MAQTSWPKLNPHASPRDPAQEAHSSWENEVLSWNERRIACSLCECTKLWIDTLQSTWTASIRTSTCQTLKRNHSENQLIVLLQGFSLPKSLFVEASVRLQVKIATANRPLSHSHSLGTEWFLMHNPSQISVFKDHWSSSVKVKITVKILKFQ